MRIPNPVAVRAAEELLAPFRIRSPGEIDLELIAERAGAIVVPRTLVGYRARLVRAADPARAHRAVIDVHEPALGTPEGRFDLGHELGHWICDHGADLLETCRGAAPQPGHHHRGEQHASDAGVAVLMPRALTLPFCASPRPALHDVRALAQAFRVPLDAAALRMIELGSAPAAVALVVEGAIRWWHGTEAFRSRLLLARGFRVSAAARGEATVVPAAVWSRTAPKRQPIELVEETVSFGDGGHTLAWLTLAV